MKKIPPAILLFISLYSGAQDSALIKQSEIYRKWPAWKMDGRRLFPKELRQEIFKVPAAIPYYKKSEVNKISSYLLLAVGMGAVLIGKDDLRKDSLHYNKEKTVYSILSITGLGGSLYFTFRFSTNLKKAIRIRNRPPVAAY